MLTPSPKINYVIAEIRDQYMARDGDIPWIVGFSGGKDSTVLLQLTWLAVLDTPPPIS